jgi:hypothetical protein
MCSCVEVHLVFVITAMGAHFCCAMPQCKVAHMAGPPDCMHSRRRHHTGESCLLYRVMPWQQSITPQTFGSILSSLCKALYPTHEALREKINSDHLEHAK